MSTARDSALVLLTIASPVALVCLVAILRGYEIVVVFRRRRDKPKP